MGENLYAFTALHAYIGSIQYISCILFVYVNLAKKIL